MKHLLTGVAVAAALAIAAPVWAPNPSGGNGMGMPGPNPGGGGGLPEYSGGGARLQPLRRLQPSPSSGAIHEPYASRRERDVGEGLRGARITGAMLSSRRGSRLPVVKLTS